MHISEDNKKKPLLSSFEAHGQLWEISSTYNWYWISLMLIMMMMRNHRQAPWVSSFEVWRFRVNSGQFSALNGHSWSPLCALVHLCCTSVHYVCGTWSAHRWQFSQRKLMAPPCAVHCTVFLRSFFPASLLTSRQGPRLSCWFVNRGTAMLSTPHPKQGKVDICCLENLLGV